MRIGRLFLLVVWMVITVHSVQAGGTKVSKFAGEFLSIGVGGRALGLGGAFVALANDVTAGYWNPAGLGQVDYPEFTLMHDERFGNLMNYDYGAVAIPVGSKGTLGFSLIRLGVDGIPDTRGALIDENGDGLLDDVDRLDYNRITFFNAADWALFISYSKKSNDRFSLGANVKLIRREIGENSALGIGFDIAALYNPFSEFFVGANFQDVTTTLIAWDTGTNELISPTMKLGSAYFFQFLGGQFVPALDFDVRFEGRKYASTANLGPVSMDLHIGMEYSFRDRVALRVGYSDIGSLTAGVGVRLPKLDIDYSFAKFDATDQLGNMHRVSLKFTLRSDRFARATE
ncbi:MAG: PorV/PorQ family protein [Bacteroidota bacterium]